MGFAATLASNSFYRLLNTGVVFFTTILLSRLAGPQGYGLLSLLIVNASFFNLLTSMGAESAITFKTASKKLNVEKTTGFIYILLVIQLLCIAFFEGFYYLWNDRFWLFALPNVAWGWAGLGFFISISLVDKYTALLNGNHLYTWCNKAILAVNIILMAALSVLFLLQPVANPIFYISIYIGCNCLQAVALIVAFHVFKERSFKVALPRRSEVIAFFSYAGVVFFSNLVQFVAYRIDFWLVNAYRTETELGFYALAVKLVQLFWILPALFATIIFPKVSSSKQDFNHEQLGTLIRVLNTTNVVAALVCFLLAPVVISVLFGTVYDESILPFQILLPGIVLFSITTVLAAYFAGMGQLKINFFGSLLCAVVILVLDLFLIPQKGIAGAAIASSVGYGVTTFYFIIRYQKKSGIPAKRLLLATKTDVKQVYIFCSHLSKRTT